MLWIAFSSLTLLMIHSLKAECYTRSQVVNCFQFINFVNDSQLHYIFENLYFVVNCFQFINFVNDSQYPRIIKTCANSCELLSVH